MTTTPSRDEMLARLAKLRAANEAATSWGAAVGARSEEIRDLERRLAVSASDGVQGSIPDGRQPALEIIEQNCWDLRCVSLPTGAGDADIGWEIVEHHMAPPKERIIGRGNSPMKALNEALGAPENVCQPPESGER